MIDNKDNTKFGICDIVDEIDSVCDFNRIVDKTQIPIEVANVEEFKHLNVQDVFAVIDHLIDAYCVKIQALDYIIDERDKGNMHHVNKHDKQRIVSRKHERCCFIRDLDELKSKIKNL